MFFVAVRFSDEKIAGLFDLARMIVQPDYARPSHITLRGPYEAKSNISPGVLAQDVGKITIGRPGTFFFDSQNTVYLSASIVGIADFWHKPNFPGGEPHLTIYDGKDRTMAWNVLSVLKRHRWGIRLNSGPMKVLDSKRTIEAEYLIHYQELASGFRMFTEGFPSAGYVRHMEKLERLIWLDRICARILELTDPSSSPK